MNSETGVIDTEKSLSPLGFSSATKKSSFRKDKLESAQKSNNKNAQPSKTSFKVLDDIKKSHSFIAHTSSENLIKKSAVLQKDERSGNAQGT